jgi:hypothetical protein
MIASNKKSEFFRLFEEFIGAYLSTLHGQRHLKECGVRRQGRQNFAEIISAAERGENITLIWSC